MSKAIVVGSGPNGLTAAIVLAKAGLDTTVFEAEPQIGGATRSAELTEPGFVHDICSAVHPLAVCSPAFDSFPLAQHGLEWIEPELPLAHPFDDGSAATLNKSLGETCGGLGDDGAAYRRAISPLIDHFPELLHEILRPLLHLPQRPMLLARFGAAAIRSSMSTAMNLFQTGAAQALFAGLAGHSVLPLEAYGSSSFAWILAAAAHAVGWPLPRGGSQNIANALASYFTSLGGRIVVNARIRSLAELPDGGLILCDVTPRQFAELGAGLLPAKFLRQMTGYRYGPGVFKMDWALNGPIPWRASQCRLAGTVHVGGTLDEIARSESAVWTTSAAVRPFVLVVQPTLFDSTRAPAGKHIAWAYCHVPHASEVSMTEAIENQIERFAPGFRDCIIARHSFSPREMEGHNANLVGGDITGGAQILKQILFRPTRRLYRTPLRGVYLCSSSTPPGGGVHGMCGFHAARLALQDARL